MRTKINLRSVPGRGLLAIAFWCMAIAQLAAQDLLVPLGNAPALDQRQQNYLRTITDNPINEDVRFVEVNLDVLKSDMFSFNPERGLSYSVFKSERGINTATMQSWCGEMAGFGIGDGSVNMVINGDEVVGHFVADAIIYGLTPLGNGLHAFYVINSGAAPLEECVTGLQNLDLNPDGKDMTKKPKFTDPDILNNQDDSKSTGECKIRVLVGFTSNAKAQYTSILAQLNNLINLANAAYDYGSINFNIELALAYQVTYTQSGNINTDLARWRSTSDGFMDDVHGMRSLWNADQCALITSTGSGLAYLSTDYGNQFSVTGTGNFGVYTFHHELGHNELCTHDLVNTTEPGTAPYAGWGNPNGCFRTIMAYQPACGTGSCSRVNVFSRSIGTYTCSGTSYIIGDNNHRNRDRLVLSRNTIVNHETTPISAYYAGDYVWAAQEAIHAAANTFFRYDGGGSNGFEMQSGSEGSFRASDYVLLEEGFWARSGSDFRAYLESCSPLVPDESALDQSDPGYDIVVQNVSGNNDGSSSILVHDVHVFPNPFTDNTFVEFEVEENQSVSVTVYDLLGKVVMQPLSKSIQVKGIQRLELETSSLQNGVYLVAVEMNGTKIVKQVVKTN